MIDFIMRIGTTKGEAIMDAKELIGNVVSVPMEVVAKAKSKALDAKAIYAASLYDQKAHGVYSGVTGTSISVHCPPWIIYAVLRLRKLDFRNVFAGYYP